MKTIAKTVIILASLFLVSSILGAILFFNEYPVDRNFNNLNYLEINESEKITIEEINEIRINLLNEDISIESYSEETLDLKLTGHYSTRYSESPGIIYNKAGGILTITINKSKDKIIGFNSENINLYVKIPKNYSGDLEIKTVSGDSEIKGIKIDKLKLESVSGDIYINNLENNYAEYKSVSGDIEIINSKRTNKIKTISGDIEMINQEIENNLDINTVSGDIDLNLFENSNINLDFSSTSGDLRNSFGEIYGGENKIFVKTTSGDLRIY